MAFGRPLRGLVLFSTTLVASARADDGELLRASLEWKATSTECLDPASLERGVNDHLGRAVFTEPDRADVGIRVTVEPPLEKLHARVELTIDGEVAGARDLDAPRNDCERLKETAILVVAMLLDVRREDVDKQRAAIAAAKAEKKAAPAQVEPRPAARFAPEPAKTPSRAVPWHADLDATFGAATGVPSAPALGGGLAATVTPPARWTGRLGVRAWKGATVERGSGDATFDALSVSLGVGPPASAFGSVARARAWLFVEAGAIRGTATGYAVSDSTARGYAALGLGLRPEIDLGSALFLCLEAEGRVLLSRPGFTYQGADGGVSTLFRPGPVGADMEVGVGWKIR